MKRMMGIYDSDPAYAEKMSERLSLRKDFPFTVFTFYDREELMRYTEVHHLQLLLVAESFAEEEILSLPADRILFLTEEQREGDAVYRYQSVTEFVREVLQAIAGSEESCDDPSEARIFGIFTPDAVVERDRVIREILDERQEKGGFREERSLLITLASFSDLAPEEEADQYDISDAYYFWKQNTLKDHLPELIQRGEAFDYIPGVYFPEDLLVISRDQFRVFLRDLARLSGRDSVYIDFAMFGNDVSLIRSLCEEQIMPYYDRSESRTRIRSYENYVSKSGNGDWWQKIVPYPLPVMSAAD